MTTTTKDKLVGKTVKVPYLTTQTITLRTNLCEILLSDSIQLSFLIKIMHQKATLLSVRSYRLSVLGEDHLLHVDIPDVSSPLPP